MEDVSPLSLAVRRLALNLGKRGYPVVAVCHDDATDTVVFAFERGVTVSLPADAFSDVAIGAVLNAVIGLLSVQAGIAPQNPEVRRPVEVSKRTLDYWLFLRYCFLTESNPSSRNTR